MIWIEVPVPAVRMSFQLTNSPAEMARVDEVSMVPCQLPVGDAALMLNGPINVAVGPAREVLLSKDSSAVVPAAKLFHAMARNWKLPEMGHSILRNDCVVL